MSSYALSHGTSQGDVHHDKRATTLRIKLETWTHVEWAVNSAEVLEMFVDGKKTDSQQPGRAPLT